MDKSKEKASAIELVVNDFGFHPKEVAEAMGIYMHRTNQQTFTKLCIAWLKYLATAEDYRFDDRNQASREVAKILMEGHDDLPGLPFI